LHLRDIKSIDGYNRKPKFVTLTGAKDIGCLRNIRCLRNPLFGEMRLGQTALALQKDIGCFLKHPMS